MLSLTYLWFWGNRGCLKLLSILEINNLGLLTIVTMVCKETQTPFFFFVTLKLSAPWPTIALFPSFFCSSCHMVCPGFCELEAENLKIIFLSVLKLLFILPIWGKQCKGSCGQPKALALQPVDLIHLCCLNWKDPTVLDCLNPCRANMADRIPQKLKGSLSRMPEELS